MPEAPGCLPAAAFLGAEYGKVDAGLFEKRDELLPCRLVAIVIGDRTAEKDQGVA